MADRSTPAIPTATPVAADALVGVKGGVMKRFAISDLPSLIAPNLTQTAETTVLVLATVTPQTAGNAKFQIHQNSFANSGAGAGTYNHGAFLGWNAGRHSAGDVVDGKPAILMGFEDNYYDPAPGDAVYGTEWYVQHYSPDGATELRPFYARCEINNAANNATIFHEIGTDSVGSWQVRKSVGNPLLYVNSSGAAITGALSVTGAITTPGFVGSSGANKDIAIRADTASGSVVFQNSAASANNLTISDGGSLNTRDGTTLNNFGATGFKIGGSATQKFGFWGATPVVRPTGTPADATDLASALTLINSLKASLIAAGLVA